MKLHRAILSIVPLSKSFKLPEVLVQNNTDLCLILDRASSHHNVQCDCHGHSASLGIAKPHCRGVPLIANIAKYDNNTRIFDHHKRRHP